MFTDTSYLHLWSDRVRGEGAVDQACADACCWKQDWMWMGSDWPLRRDLWQRWRGGFCHTRRDIWWSCTASPDCCLHCMDNWGGRSRTHNRKRALFHWATGDNKGHSINVIHANRQGWAVVINMRHQATRFIAEAEITTSRYENRRPVSTTNHLSNLNQHAWMAQSKRVLFTNCPDCESASQRGRK